MEALADHGERAGDGESGADGSTKTDGGALRLSVVLATYNRQDLLTRVLGYLAAQTLPKDQFEVIVVDDGSKVPVRAAVESKPYPFALTLIEQKNAGPAAARHHGVLQAKGDILVLIDDDMELPKQFLEEHLAYHASGEPTAVFGRYASDPAIGSKPIFERYHGLKWDQLSSAIAAGRLVVDGTLLATGNASMRRADYLRVGGLDLTLPRAEDMALGLDLEAAGVRLVFSDRAYSVHLSDHTKPETWRGRSFLHGILETRIAKRHPDLLHADPWRHAFALPLSGRILCLPSVVFPRLGEKLADLAFRAAVAADSVGLERPALRATGLVYGMDYFRGMRAEAGSLSALAAGCVDFLERSATAVDGARPPANTARPPRLPRGVPAWLARAAAALRKRRQGAQ